MLTVIVISLVFFVVGNIVRVARFLRMPTSVRWELYPIPKGPHDRQSYGGSYFEQSDWWTKSPDTGHSGELAFMAKEVFLLRSVWENFRALWVWSWLLHGGLYFYILATVLAAVEVLLPSSGHTPYLHSAVMYGYWLA